MMDKPRLISHDKLVTFPITYFIAGGLCCNNGSVTLELDSNWQTVFFDLAQYGNFRELRDLADEKIKQHRDAEKKKRNQS